MRLDGAGQPDRGPDYLTGRYTLRESNQMLTLILAVVAQNIALAMLVWRVAYRRGHRHGKGIR